MPIAEAPRGAASRRTRTLEPDTIEVVLSGADLSEWFNPFLVRFAQETIGAGGQASVAEEEGRAVGLVLSHPAERFASVFTRSPEIAGALVPDAGSASWFAEVDLPRPREAFDILACDLDRIPPHRFRHPVRQLDDTSRVGAFVEHAYGGAPLDWLRAARAAGERCLGVELDGTLCGVSWVLVAGGAARLHSLTVRADVRRLGIGTDLVFARLEYARALRAGTAFSEISEHNSASRTIAERAGMRRVGRWYLYGRPATGWSPVVPGPVSRPTSG